MGLHTANPTPPKLSSSAIPPAGIARRAGRSPSAARKLPEQKPRSPRGMSETGKPKRGASGGMQGGPRRGRSPITGPALPSPEAAQTIIMRKPPCPQGTKITSQRTSPVSLPLPPPEAAKIKESKSPRVRRTQHPLLKGQALLCFLQSARRAYPRHATQATKAIINKKRPFS